MASQFLVSHSSRLTFTTLLLIAFVAAACSSAPASSGQPTQAALPTIASPQPTTQAMPTTLPANPSTTQPPQGPSQGSTGSGTIDPCKLVTSKEVTGLLGSMPTPDSRSNMPGDRACDFMVTTGLLSIDAASNPEAAAEFQLASGQFAKAPGSKTIQAQGTSIAVYGSDNADGNGTPGFTAYLNKGDILVLIKLYSKTYTYNPDSAVGLLQAIAGRLP